MAAEDGSIGAWCGKVESRSSTFIASPFCESAGWEAQEIQWFVVFVNKPNSQ